MGTSYIHHTPGRLRIRVPALKNDAEKIEFVKTILSIDGTTALKANPLTGSVTVKYDPQQLKGDRLLAILSQYGLYCKRRTKTMDAHLKQASQTAARKVSRAMVGWALGRVLEANGLSFIAAFI